MVFAAALSMLPGCGGSDTAAGKRKEALRALVLASESSRLNREIAAIVPRLATESSQAERGRLRARLGAFQGRAQDLASRAEALPPDLPGAQALLESSERSDAAANQLERVAAAPVAKDPSSAAKVERAARRGTRELRKAELLLGKGAMELREPLREDGALDPADGVQVDDIVDDSEATADELPDVGDQLAQRIEEQGVAGEPPSASEIAAVMRKTHYLGAPEIYFAPSGPIVTVDDGQGGTLTAQVGYARPPGSAGDGAFVFFWHDGKFEGTDTLTESYRIGRISRAGRDAIAIPYPDFRPGDGACCPHGPVVITYRWAGRVVPSDTPRSNPFPEPREVALP